MRWMWTRAGDEAAVEVTASGPSRCDGKEIERALEQRGIQPELRPLLAKRLEASLGKHGNASHAAMLDGVAMALGVQSEVSEELSRTLRGLRELERLMGAFSGELSKLDEVLEVLAAYVRRMRSSKPEEADRVLH
jgi:hypothetical protein